MIPDIRQHNLDEIVKCLMFNSEEHLYVYTGIRDIFKQFGNIENIRNYLDKNTKKMIELRINSLDTSDVNRFLRCLNQYIDEVFGINIDVFMHINDSLKDVEDEINRQQNLFKIRMYKNHKVKVRMDSADMEKFKKPIIDNYINGIKKYENDF